MYQKEVSREIRKYFKLKENKITTFRNLWNMANVVPRMIFIVLETQKRQKV